MVFLGANLLEKPDVFVVTDVLACPSSVVTECWDGVSLDSDWEFVEQSFSFSKKKAPLCWKRFEKR